MEKVGVPVKQNHEFYNKQVNKMIEEVQIFYSFPIVCLRLEPMSGMINSVTELVPGVHRISRGDKEPSASSSDNPPSSDGSSNKRKSSESDTELGKVRM